MLTKPDKSQIAQMNAEFARQTAQMEQDKQKAAMDAIYQRKISAVQQMPPRAGKIWGSNYGDIPVSEKPSLETTFQILYALDTEMDNLRSKDWSRYNPKRVGIWWKRIPFKRKLDWFFAVPGILALVAVISLLVVTLFNQHWLAGSAALYALAVGGYIVWRHGE